MARWMLIGYVGVAVSFVAAVGAPFVAGCGDASSGSGRGGAGGAGDCNGGVADEETTPVPVRITNHTSADIFVNTSANYASCTIREPLSITDAQGTSLEYMSPGPCGGTCGTPGGGVCTTTCITPSPTRIAPSGVLTIAWNGGVLVTGCDSGTGVPGCRVWRKPTASTLTFTAKAYLETTCQSGDASCPCVADANGTCEVAGSYAKMDGATVSASATYHAGDASIDIVFE